MSTDGYVREKLATGVSCLVGIGGIHSRLVNAFISMTTINGSNFSDEALGKRFDALYSRVTSVSAQGGEGKIQATINTMSDEDASGVAHELFDLYASALRALKK